MNSGVAVGKVPGLRARWPWRQAAGHGQHGQQRQKAPRQHGQAVVVLKNGVLAFSPAKAEPLLAVAEA
jgi:hypothetical protein